MLGSGKIDIEHVKTGEGRGGSVTLEKVVLRGLL